MRTECNPDPLLFALVEVRAVVTSFDGSAITSDAGALLLGATDRAERVTMHKKALWSRVTCRSPTPD